MRTWQGVVFYLPFDGPCPVRPEERQGPMVQVTIQSVGGCDYGENAIAARAREMADRVQRLPKEVVASFALPDAKARASRLQQLGAEILVGLRPVVSWIERRRHPDSAQLVVQRLFDVANEAESCAGSEIPEYVGGKVSRATGQPSDGATRTAALAVMTLALADHLREWATDIEAEDASRRGGYRQTKIAVIEEGEPPKPPAVKRSRTTREEYNLRAREALKSPKLRSARGLARAIGCSLGTVSKLPAWRAYQEKAKRQKARAPKAVALTEGVLANQGAEDKELERLIAEQQADFEASPLVSHARKHRRQRRKV